MLAGAGAAAALPVAHSEPAEPKAAAPPGKIALEEHFMVPDFMEYFAETYQNISPEIAKLAPVALQDFDDKRIPVMDQYGIEFAVLSLAGPGVQVENDAAVAIRKSKSVNDFLAREIQKRPTRYGGFAHLPMQNPTAAADELERSIHDLGFQGP
jgi:2,3-dihydroxybenzoate decarboxylase